MDLRGGFLLPGFIDTHIHFPQLRVLGGLGRSLLDWLEHCALPEEARMADRRLRLPRRARDLFMRWPRTEPPPRWCSARTLLRATAALFEAAEAAGLRIAAGQVLSDRRLRPELHQTPERAYRESSLLIRDSIGSGRLLYAVTPRFALSASEAMLEVCQTLLREHAGLLLPNASQRKSAGDRGGGAPVSVGYAIIWRSTNGSACAAERGDGAQCSSHRFRTGSPGSERRHGRALPVRATPRSAADLFPMRRHMNAGVRCALGTDVGRRHGIRHAQRRLAGVPDAANRARWNAPGCRPFALPRDARGSRGARPGRRNRRLSRWQVRRFRLSASAAAQPARSGARTGADVRSGCWRRSLLWPARRACARCAWRVRGISFRRGGTMTIAELNLLDRARLCRTPSAGSSNIRRGWPSAPGESRPFATCRTHCTPR